MRFTRHLALIPAAFERRMPGVGLADERVIGGMATMPSRIGTFPRALASIVRQVDLFYLYLDGFDAVPDFVRRYGNVIPILSRDVPELHANGKLMGLTLEKEPCLYVCVDDDFHFRRNFVANMRAGLARYNDKAVVGLHGSTFKRPLGSYRDKTTVAYSKQLEADRQVDVLGTGAVLFNAAVLRFDVRTWPFGNMADLGVAIEAARAGLPMIAIARRRKEILPLDVKQADSLHVARKRDGTLQMKLAAELLALRDQAR